MKTYINQGSGYYATGVVVVRAESPEEAHQVLGDQRVLEGNNNCWDVEFDPEGWEELQESHIPSILFTMFFGE